MLQPNVEVQMNGPDGSIFLPEISSRAELNTYELRFWLARGEWAELTSEQQQLVQAHFEENRARIIGEKALDQPGVL